ncbi:hypothetical protein N7513_008100 [Penicillium frequentans]|nr:hypothetical protein N7513_008100 [Penicillium glabrum]
MADSTKFPFVVTEHTIDGQHIREYPNAAVDPNSTFKLVLKRYTPVDNPNPQPGDVTIIGAHGCGFPKELYEPLWEDLLTRSRQDGYRIRSIWIADVANLGASGLANEKFLGNDPSWIDHSRDLLYMINKFRDEMPQPIVGVGHSMGAGQLVLLSLLHPQPQLSKKQKSRIKDGTSASSTDGSFTLIAIFLRQLLPMKTFQLKLSKQLPLQARNTKKYSSTFVQTHQATYQSAKNLLQTHLHTMTSSTQTSSDPPETTTQFYRYEPILAWKMLKHLRPPVLYVLGQSSPIAAPETREKILKRTGAGIGGSGGVKALRVEEKIIPGSHQLPLERVLETAAAVGPWISNSVQRWKDDEARIAEGWACRPMSERLKSMADWVPKLEKMMASERRESRL